jgi:hypothetical protein
MVGGVNALWSVFPGIDNDDDDRILSAIRPSQRIQGGQQIFALIGCGDAGHMTKGPG